MKPLSTFLAVTCLSAAAYADAPSTSPLPSFSWSSVPNRMLDERWAPAYALLADRRHALIAGGFSYTKGVCVDSADIYDERRHKFIHAHGHLHVARDFANAVLLPNGSVLVAGGYNTEHGSLDSAELYVPKRNRFELLKSKMSNRRELFTATALVDGTVLCVAGLDLHHRGTVNTADLYDPKTATFTPLTSTLAQDRFGHDAVRLRDGRVLIAGGKSWQVGHPDQPLASAEIFDPSTRIFHRVGDMSVPRDRPTLTLLPNGKVLVAGGQNGPDGSLAIEIFDSVTETFTTLPITLHTARMAHSATLLPSGDVLVAGGWCPTAHTTTASVELLTPGAMPIALDRHAVPVPTQTFTLSNGRSLPVDIHDFATVLFPDGLLLIAGGKQVDKAEGSLDGGWMTETR